MRALVAAMALAAWAAAPCLAETPPIPGFVEVIPAEGRAAVELSASQVVRVGRVEGNTVIDTAAWVQQRSSERLEAVAQRLMAAGARLMPLTDLNGNRIYVSVERIVLVRGSEARHAAGAQAAIVMVGLRFNTDVAVRESPEEVKAALRRALAGETPEPATAPR